MIVSFLDFENPAEITEWNDFAARGNQLYHHSAWADIISSAYGFSPYYMMIREGGKIISTFPLFRVKIPFLRDELVSLPHVESGGMLNPGFYQLYIDAIYERIRSRSIRIYQFGEPIDDFPANREEVVMISELPPRKEQIISNIKSSTTRTDMRRSLEQAGHYDFAEGNTKEMLNDFYDLYLRKMREFGTPPHGFRFIEKIAEAYGPNCRLLRLKEGERVLGAGLYVLFGGCLFNLYLVIPGEELKRKTGYLFEYKAMELAITMGAGHLVLGRCEKNSGVYFYKTKLNGVPVPLYLYKFVLVPGGYRAVNEKTAKEKYRALSVRWSSLPPYLTDTFGPLIRRWVY